MPSIHFTIQVVQLSNKNDNHFLISLGYTRIYARIAYWRATTKRSYWINRFLVSTAISIIIKPTNHTVPSPRLGHQFFRLFCLVAGLKFKWLKIRSRAKFVPRWIDILLSREVGRSFNKSSDRSTKNWLLSKSYFTEILTGTFTFLSIYFFVYFV